MLKFFSPMSPAHCKYSFPQGCLLPWPNARQQLSSTHPLAHCPPHPTPVVWEKELKKGKTCGLR